MLLPNDSLARLHYLFRQLQRILPSMHLVVCGCKLSGHPLTIFAYIAEMGYPIVPTAETSIDVSVFPVCLPTAPGVSPQSPVTIPVRFLIRVRAAIFLLAHLA